MTHGFLELRLKNFRGFANAVLDFEDITVLVGRNGSGKSSLGLALDFLRDSLTINVAGSLDRWGGLDNIRKRKAGMGKPPDVGVAVKLRLGARKALYGFRLAGRASSAGFVVKEEALIIEDGPSFRRKDSKFETNVRSVRPAPDPESLVFPAIAGAEKLWQTSRALIAGARTYRLIPSQLRSDPKTGSARFLEGDGVNAGDILSRLKPSDLDWIVGYLSQIAEGIQNVAAVAEHGRRRIRMVQQQSAGTVTFEASSLSDGTLRALGILLALRQTRRGSVVFIDEIEDSIHPFGAAVLMEAVEASSEWAQVVFSSHSPEVLSNEVVTGERTRVIQWTDGSCEIFRLNRKTIQKLVRPITVGRLLSSNALWTETSSTSCPKDFLSL